MALAFAVGAAWFAVSTVLVAGPLSDSVAVTVCVLVVDVLAVLAIAHYWDIPYAVTVGVASVVALDWYYLPPTHPAALPDARNSFALAAYLLFGVRDFGVGSALGVFLFLLVIPAMAFNIRRFRADQ